MKNSTDQFSLDPGGFVTFTSVAKNSQTKDSVTNLSDATKEILVWQKYFAICPTRWPIWPAAELITIVSPACERSLTAMIITMIIHHLPPTMGNQGQDQVQDHLRFSDLHETKVGSESRDSKETKSWRFGQTGCLQLPDNHDHSGDNANDVDRWWWILPWKGLHQMHRGSTEFLSQVKDHNLAAPSNQPYSLNIIQPHDHWPSSY